MAMEFLWIPFIFLGLTLLSCWIRPDIRISGILLFIALLTGILYRNLQLTGLLITVGWGFLWFLYVKERVWLFKILFFTLIVALSFGFKLHLLPGFIPLHLAPKLTFGFDSPLVGLFPLALLVPLASRRSEWKEIFSKGLVYSLIGICTLALLALATNAVRLVPHLPSFPIARYAINLILVAIPEEAFYRGFLQRELTDFFAFTRWDIRWQKILALFLSSLLFTIAHIFWASNAAILLFVFVASLLYGTVYLLTKRIESAILCHFLLNLFHMTFFNY
jgi:membrane protease YdiL (CAAX protease family)